MPIESIDCMVSKGILLPDSGARLKKILALLPETANGLYGIIAAVLSSNEISPSSSSSSSSSYYSNALLNEDGSYLRNEDGQVILNEN